MMTTINETILASVAGTMVERCTSLEYQLAACQAELAEARLEFSLVHGDLEFWRAEAERLQPILVTSMQDLKLAQTVIREYNQYYDRKEGLNL